MGTKNSPEIRVSCWVVEVIARSKEAKEELRLAADEVLCDINSGWYALITCFDSDMKSAQRWCRFWQNKNEIGKPPAFTARVWNLVSEKEEMKERSSKK